MERNSAFSASVASDHPDVGVDEILEQRARLLSQAPIESGTESTVHVLLFRVRTEQYAVELQTLDSVHSAHGLAPVPCTPSRIAGIVNLRGEVLTVLNMAVVMGLANERAAEDGAQIIVVHLPTGRVGLLVDRVVGIDTLTPDRLAAPLSDHDYTVGIDQSSTILIRLDHLLTPERLDVVEHVG